MVRTRWTIHDVELLPDPWDDTRYEIIDGELSVTHQPPYSHQLVAFHLAFELEAWGRSGHMGRTVLAPAVIFAEDEAVAPDVVWVTVDRLASVLSADGRFHAAPDLIIEVVSPGADSERRDREAKAMLYNRRGVREYWIADWRRRRLEVYRREDRELRLTGTLLEEDALESPMLPGFRLPLSQLFADIPRE